MLIVIKLNVIILNVVLNAEYRISVIVMLNVIAMSVVMLNVIMLSVVLLLFDMLSYTLQL